RRTPGIHPRRAGGLFPVVLAARRTDARHARLEDPPGGRYAAEGDRALPDRRGAAAALNPLGALRPRPPVPARSPRRNPAYRRSTHHIMRTAEARNAMLGTTAAANGGQFCSRPMCEKRLFSMWKKMPIMMPRNTLKPTMPARACM